MTECHQDKCSKQMVQEILLRQETSRYKDTGSSIDLRASTVVYTVFKEMTRFPLLSLLLTPMDVSHSVLLH